MPAILKQPAINTLKQPAMPLINHFQKSLLPGQAKVIVIIKKASFDRFTVITGKHWPEKVCKRSLHNEKVSISTSRLD